MMNNYVNVAFQMCIKLKMHCAKKMWEETSLALEDKTKFVHGIETHTWTLQITHLSAADEHLVTVPAS